MKYKVRATHYIDAPSWVEAEKQVEQGLSDPDAIDSEPLSKAPADIIRFGISAKIYEQQLKIYFTSFIASTAPLLYNPALRKTEGRIMKTGIHPDYSEIKVTCSCCHSFTTQSTLAQDLPIEVCAKCHPFYTGKEKIIDTMGREEKFKKRAEKKKSTKKKKKKTK